MDFTVLWVADAAEEYFELWSDPELRQSVVTARHRIEAALQSNPNVVGESRSDNKRIYFESPLAIVYEVFVTERRVNILRIRYYSKR